MSITIRAQPRPRRSRFALPPSPGVLSVMGVMPSHPIALSREPASVPCTAIGPVLVSVNSNMPVGMELNSTSRGARGLRARMRTATGWRESVSSTSAIG